MLQLYLRKSEGAHTQVEVVFHAVAEKDEGADDVEKRYLAWKRVISQSEP